MAAILTQNRVDTPELHGNKSIWHTAIDPNQQESASFAVRRSSNDNTQPRLSNGTKPGSFHDSSMYSADHSQNTPRHESLNPSISHTPRFAKIPNLSTSNADEIPENMYRLEDYDPYTEKWIHRDKLARIESEELQAAGYHLPTQTGARTRRTQSTDKLREERRRSDQYDPGSLGSNGRQLSVSPPAEEAENNGDGRNWDLRTPEEIALADPARGDKGHGTATVRKNGSKIPVLTSSPLPIPSQRLDRDTPLRRKRRTSGSIQDDDTSSSSGPRMRRSSGAGQALLDEAQSNTGTPQPSSGPQSASKSLSVMTPTSIKAGPKPAGGTPTNPNSISTPTAPGSSNSTRKVTPAGIRKASNAHKPRVPSDSSPASQTHQQSIPRSRDTTERPRTAVNRPEGEAPWIATMYKPDPRLPPDQQIIPTHAKKQQQQHEHQQRQEYDASPPSSSAPTSRPHSDEARVLPHQNHHHHYDHNHQDANSAAHGPESKPSSLWPPTNGHSRGHTNGASIPESRRPSTGHGSNNSSFNGGYSTMPKVSNNSHRKANSTQSPTITPTSPFSPAADVGQQERKGSGAGSGGGSGPSAGLRSHGSPNHGTAATAAERMQSHQQQQQRQQYGVNATVCEAGAPYGDDGSKQGGRRGCAGCCIVM